MEKNSENKVENFDFAYFVFILHDVGEKKKEKKLRILLPGKWII